MSTPAKGLHITTDKVITEKVYDGLDDYQRDVGGAIEPVDLLDGSTMYVDEEFLIKNDMAFNSIATDLAGLNHRSDLLITGIGGNVVVVGPLDEDGYSTDLTDRVRRQVQKIFGESGGVWVT